MFDHVDRALTAIPTEAHLPSQASIEHCLSQCLQTFKMLLRGLSHGQPSKLMESSASNISLLESWKTELGRLRVWSQNMRIGQQEGTSLDHQLRFSSHVRNVIVHLLEDVEQLLLQCCQRKDVETSPTVSDASDTDEDALGESVDNNSDPSFLHQQVQSRINALFELTLSSQKAAKIDLWTRLKGENIDQQRDRALIYIKQSLSKKASSHTRERLMTSLAIRFALIEEIRSYNKEKNPEVAEFVSIGYDPFGSSKLDSQPEPLRTMPKGSLFDATRTTYLIAPTKLSLTNIFQCPCCLSNVKVGTLEDLSAHFLEDIAPYPCLMADCPISRASFAAPTAWISHMQDAHPNEWQRVMGMRTCVICGLQLGESEDMICHLEDHLVTISIRAFFHPSMIRPTQSTQSNSEARTYTGFRGDLGSGSSLEGDDLGKGKWRVSKEEDSEDEGFQTVNVAKPETRHSEPWLAATSDISRQQLDLRSIKGTSRENDRVKDDSRLGPSDVGITQDLGGSTRRNLLGYPNEVFDRRRFEIAIVCALGTESTAVEAFFDEVYDAALYGKAHGDSNAYTLGRIGQHDVVLTYLPSIGKTSSSLAAAGLKTSFININLSLLVGICGSVPHREEDGHHVDILLGDVVISTGLVQYDFGRQYGLGRSVRKDTIADNSGRPPPGLRSLIHKCQAGIEASKLRRRVQQYVKEICSKEYFVSYARPTTQDILYPSEYLHRHRSPQICAQCNLSEQQSCEKARMSTCEEVGCDRGVRIQRAQRTSAKATTPDSPEIRIHWGLIASGDSVIRSGIVRDEIARAENVIAFEMEGAGLWEACPTIVVKGVCDYSDSHKNKGWQRYSALTAAAAAKALLMNWTPSGANFASSGEGSSRMSPTLRYRSTRTSYLIPFDHQVSHSDIAPIWIVPFDQRANLIGRQAEKVHIQHVLFSSTMCSRVAIEGLGGVGKSRLALEIAYLTRTSQLNRSVFWIQCSDIPSFERDCRKIAQAVDLPGAEDLSRDPKILIKQYLDRDETADWLLILDSADDEDLWSARAAASQSKDALIRYIPRGRQGAILITTRTHKIAVDTANKEIVKLSQLSPDDSHSMLQDLLQGYEPAEDTDIALQLLDYLTHLPLAIVQAAAFMNQNSLNVNEYLEVWKDSSEDEIIEILSRDFTDDNQYRDAQKPIAKTWLISFKNISYQYPLAATVLSYMSCLDHKDILRSSIPPLDASRFRQHEAFGILQGYAFIQAQRRDTSDTVFDMHRLVHLATRNYLRQLGEFSKHLRVVAKHLCPLIPEAGIDDTAYWQRYLPHVEKVVSASDVETETCHLELQERLSAAHYANGSYVKALTHRRALVEKLSAQGEPNELQLMQNLAALADILRLLGRGQASVTAAEEAFELSKRVVPKGHSENIFVMECLARAYGYFGNGEEALQLSLDTVALAEKCDYPSRDLRAATIMSTLHTLSFIYQRLRRWHEQVKVLEKIIQQAKDLKNNNLVYRAQFDIALATAYSRVGKADLAEKILLQLQQEFESTLGKFHRLALSIISCLGEAYSFQGRYLEAENLYRDLLEMYTKIGRQDDAQVLRCRNQLAYVIFEQGRFLEAKEIQLVTIGMATLATGKDSVITLDNLEVLAWSYRRLGKRRVAVGVMLGCYSRSAQTLGPTHSDTRNRLELARAWRDSTRSTKSKKYHGKGHTLGM